MRYEFQIALRHLRGKRRQTSVSLVTTIAVVGVTLGVAALIVVLAVMSGFEAELRDKILGFNAHIIVYDRADEAIAEYRGLLERAREVKGVEEASAFIITKAMARVGMRSEGVVLKGIEPELAGRVLSLEDDLLAGRLEGLGQPADEGPLGPVYGILLGDLLAEQLDAEVGERLELLIPGSGGPDGREAIVESFEVTGVFHSGMHQYDATWAYTSLEGAQRFLGLGDRVTGLELSVHDIWKTRDVLPGLALALGPRYWMQDWQAMNADFFKALHLQKWVLFIILCLIVMVAAFNVVSTLVLIVMEKDRDIGVLKALGATDGAIRRIFLCEGLAIGLAGTLSGLLLGSALCLAADTWKLVRIEAEVYFMSHLPFHLHLDDVALVCGASLLISFLTTLVPSSRAARLDPVDAIRYE